MLGRVDGDVVGAERVEIGPRGALRGSIETRALVVHDGGQLDGDCRVAPPRARDRARPGARTGRRRESGSGQNERLGSPGQGEAVTPRFGFGRSARLFSAVMRAALPERLRR